MRFSSPKAIENLFRTRKSHRISQISTVLHQEPPTHVRWVVLVSLIISSSSLLTMASAFALKSLQRRSHLHCGFSSFAPKHCHFAIKQDDHNGNQLQQPSTSALYLPSASIRTGSTANQPIQSVAAPMVAASDYAFRCLCRQYGVDLVFTQMLHAKNIVESSMFRTNHLDLLEYNTASQTLLPSQINCIQGETQSIPHNQHLSPYTTGPVIVQLAGHDPDTVVKAAQYILQETEAPDGQGRVHGFDLNLGCPQAIAKKGRYGAFLMEQDPELVYRILEALRTNLPQTVAVSAKIRLPAAMLFNDHDDNDLLLLKERIHRLIDCGVNFITLHGRTLHENKTAVKNCHVDQIKRAVELANQYSPGFPIIANGGMQTYKDVMSIQQLTGAAACMSSEGLLETPNIFHHDTSQLSARDLLEQQFQFAREYLYWCRLYPPVPGVLGHDGGSFNVVRGHLFKFLHRYIQEHTDVRDRLASHKLRTLTQADALIDELYDRYHRLSDNQLEALSSSNTAESSWYRRHWKSMENVHQRSSVSQPITATAGQQQSQQQLVMTNEQRKGLLRSRIAKLRQQRIEMTSSLP